MNIKPNKLLKTTGAIRARRLGALFMAGALTLLPARVEAFCNQWDVSGEWEIHQGPTDIYLTLDQKGSNVNGTARYEAISKSKGKYTAQGTVRATMIGGRFDGEIRWSDKNTVGVYSGFVRSNKRLTGSMYDKAYPGDTIYWSSKEAMECADKAPANSAPVPVATPPPTPRQGQIVITGKSRVTTSASPQAPVSTGRVFLASTPKSPIIPAGQKQTSTMVVWDGGANHPNAELWVQVDDEDETLVARQATGTRRMTVERDKTYLYILKDEGRLLTTFMIRAE